MSWVINKHPQWKKGLFEWPSVPELLELVAKWSKPVIQEPAGEAFENPGTLTRSYRQIGCREIILTGGRWVFPALEFLLNGSSKPPATPKRRAGGDDGVEQSWPLSRLHRKPAWRK